MAESVLERLQKTNPDAEIWWDSSPLIFDSWVKKNVEAAPAAKKKELEAQLKRLFAWEGLPRLHHQSSSLAHRDQDGPGHLGEMGRWPDQGQPGDRPQGSVVDDLQGDRPARGGETASAV